MSVDDRPAHTHHISWDGDPTKGFILVKALTLQIKPFEIIQTNRMSLEY